MMPNGTTNAPSEFPPMTPMAIEILDCWAVEFAEHNALRQQCGLPPRAGRTYSRDDRLKGRLTHPTALMQHDGNMDMAARE